MSIQNNREEFLLWLEFEDAEIPHKVHNDEHRTILRRMVTLYGYLYEHDEKYRRNPLWAWRAYITTRALRDPIPEWVLEYLDFVGENIWCMGNVDWNGPKDPTMDLPTAFGVKREGRPHHGRGTVIKSGGSLTWLLAGISVSGQMEQGDKETEAIRSVAKLMDLSEPTVRRAWKRYQRIFPSDN